MNRITNRWITSVAAVLAAAWGINWLAGKMFADKVAQLFGGTIVARGGGKIMDASAFVAGRLTELVGIATCAFVVALLTLGIDMLLRRAAWFRRARGVWLGLLGFFAVNSFIAAANHTALFWLPFFDSQSTDNYAQFQIKRYLAKESKTPERVVLLGNSQTSSNISESVLNSIFARDVWFTELHQSGVHGFDMLIIARELRGVGAQTAVLYVTPIYFFGGTNGKVASRFFSTEDVPDIVRLGGWHVYPEGALRTGLFGQFLPLYRHNPSFSQRVLGSATTGIAQRRFDKSLELDLDTQARRRVASLNTGAEAAMHAAAFSNAIDEMAQAFERVVIVAGRNYPLLEELDPAAQPGMQAILSKIAGSHSSVTILEEASFFKTSREDFMDLIHFNPETQARFSEALAVKLRELSVGRAQ